MLKLIRTQPDNPDFIALVKLLDADLAIRDGADHAIYAQFNTLGNIKYAVVGYENNEPAACGAIKEYDSDTMEIKRMYVKSVYRNKGIATKILVELEQWSGELSYSRCILETGKNQPEAIALYKKSGFRVITNYGQYTGVENSICFMKEIR